MTQAHFTDDLAECIQGDAELDEASKAQVLRVLAGLKQTKVNILITGATGCGKSSTINALFNADKAKVGQGVAPETMDIRRYDLNNIVLFDSPGLGDGKEADLRHAENIVKKLYEQDNQGNPLIDLVLVILDGSSRDLGTSFELINNVIIPSLGNDPKRLLIAINQADMAMKGRGWNAGENRPEPELVKFLNEKVDSTRRRILEATGVDVEPIYYSAGYKDGDKQQNPYNLSKLLAHILRHTQEDKRVVFAQDMNRDQKMWRDDDRLENYREEIKASFIESACGVLGDVLGGKGGRAVGEAIGRGLNTVVDTLASGISSLGRGVRNLFSSWF